MKVLCSVLSFLVCLVWVLAENRHDEVIAFTAWKQRLQLYVGGDTILWDGISVNEGNGFQTSTGRFYCQYDGIYYVSVTSRRVGDYGTDLEVVRGSEAFMHLYDYNTNNDDNIVSNSALIDCQQGQAILVKGRGNQGAIYGEPGVIHSSFTVLMMWRLPSLSNTPSSTLHNDTVAGFSAYLSTGWSYDSSEVVIFDEAIYSSPDYSTSTGLYTCPISGVYYTIMHLQKYNDDDLHLGLSKGVIISLHTEDTGTSNYYNTVSNSRLIRCRAGEVLSVRGVEAGSVYGSSRRHTTFSAMLMYEEDNWYHSSFIGFTMFKTASQSYNSGDKITFEAELLNIGNAYDIALNVFICPDSALYFCSVTFKKVGTTILDLSVVLETPESGTLFRSQDVYTGNPDNMVSNSGLFRCLTGSHVWIAGAGTGSVDGSASKALSTFTIMKIYNY